MNLENNALGLREVPLAQVRPSTFNPRKTFHEQAEAELEASVREHGVLQPLVLRVIPEGFEVVAGERRYRAAVKVALSVVPAMVRELTDQQALEIALLENLQREDVDPLEEADGMARLIESGAYTVDTLAAKLGKSKSHIYGRLQLRQLAPEVVEAVGQGFIPASAVQGLAGLENEEQAELLKGALNKHPGEHLTVKQFKTACREVNKVKNAEEEAAQKEAQRKFKERQAKWEEEQKERDKAGRKEKAERKAKWASVQKELPAVLKKLEPMEIVRRILAGSEWVEVKEFKIKEYHLDRLERAFGDLLKAKEKPAKGAKAKKGKRHEAEQPELLEASK